MNLARRGTSIAVAVLLFGIVSQWLPPGALTNIWCWLAGGWLLALLVEGGLAHAQPLDGKLHIAAAPRLGRATIWLARFHNGGMRRLQLDLYWAAPRGTSGTGARGSLMLPAAGTAELAQKLVPLRLGAIGPEPVMLRQLGRLQLAWWSRRLSLAGSPPPVVPDLLGLGSDAIAGNMAGNASARRSSAGFELLGLRDYQRGDPLRAVAWKAAARSGRLLVRDLAEEQHADILLVIDSGRVAAQQFGTMTRLHHCVNVAARLAERASELGDHAGLLAFAGTVQTAVPLRGGVVAVRAIRRALAQLRPQPGESDPFSAALAIQRLCRRRALVVWFTDIESGVHGGALPQALRRLRPKHMPLIASLRDTQLDELAQRAPSNWKDPYIALAATHALERTALATAELRRLGCEVVEAAPAELDKALVNRYLELRRRHRA
jgi:uncharacterized protein (DUF58 family)